MAMTINSSPILTGESATAFAVDAENNSHLPTPRLSRDRELELQTMENKSRELYLRLFGKVNG